MASNSGTGLPENVSGAWVTFANHSLVVDAGSPTDSYSNEPTPNGGRINLGAYGNTAQASKSVASYLNVLSPNGNETWLTNSSYSILWSADNLNTGSTTYRIELLKGAAVVHTIAAAAPDTGIFGWTVPTNLISGNDYSIRIVRTTGSGLVDTSNSVFTIINTNIAPSLSGTFTFPDITEDIASVDNTGTLVSTMLAGRLIDADGPAAGIAITAVNNTQGTWEYALDGVSFSDIQSQLAGARYCC